MLHILKSTKWFKKYSYNTVPNATYLRQCLKEQRYWSLYANTDTNYIPCILLSDGPVLHWLLCSTAYTASLTPVSLFEMFQTVLLFLIQSVTCCNSLFKATDKSSTVDADVCNVVSSAYKHVQCKLEKEQLYFFSVFKKIVCYIHDKVGQRCMLVTL